MKSINDELSCERHDCRIAVRCSRQLHARLVAAAASQGVAISSLVKEIVTKALDGEGGQVETERIGGGVRMEQRRTVLVVDDELGTRLSLRFLLSPKYQVIEAESGDDALDALASHAVHLVISDVQMPGMDGCALLQAIYELDPTLPVVMITAYGSPERRREALSSGAVAFLTKPFENEEVLDVVTQHIRGSP